MPGRSSGPQASPPPRPRPGWGLKPAKGGRVAVGPDLAVPGHPGTYVIGDAALPQAPDGKPLPGVALVAKQQGLRRSRHPPAAARAGGHEAVGYATLARWPPSGATGP